MLDYLALTNFRKHKHLSVEFAPGLNVITGPNNAGKTTLIRAIRYLCFNSKAAKDRTITVGESECSMEVGVGGKRLSRRISSSENEVVLPDGTKFTHPTPDTISDLKKLLTPLGLGPLALPTGGDWWPQFHSVGGMFLVGAGPTEAKRTLSALGHIDIYERARDVCRNDRDRLSSEVKQLGAQLDEATDKRDTTRQQHGLLAPIRDRVQVLETKLEGTRSKLEAIKQSGSSLNALIRKMLPEEDAIRASALEDVLAEHQRALTDVRKRSTTLVTAMSQLQTVLDQSDTAPKHVLEATGSMFKAYAEKHSQMEAAVHETSALIDQLQANEEAIAHAKEEESRVSEELAELRSSALAAGICPILGGACPRSSDS